MICSKSRSRLRNRKVKYTHKEIMFLHVTPDLLDDFVSRHLSIRQNRNVKKKEWIVRFPCSVNIVYCFYRKFSRKSSQNRRQCQWSHVSIIGSASLLFGCISHLLLLGNCLLNSSRSSRSLSFLLLKSPRDFFIINFIFGRIRFLVTYILLLNCLFRWTIVLRSFLALSFEISDDLFVIWGWIWSGFVDDSVNELANFFLSFCQITLKVIFHRPSNRLWSHEIQVCILEQVCQKVSEMRSSLQNAR